MNQLPLSVYNSDMGVRTQKRGYRKFGFVLLVFIVSSFMLWHGKISDEVYATIVGWLVGSYMVGNVGSAFAGNAPEIAKNFRSNPDPPQSTIEGDVVVLNPRKTEG